MLQYQSNFLSVWLETNVFLKQSFVTDDDPSVQHMNVFYIFDEVDFVTSTLC